MGALEIKPRQSSKWVDIHGVPVQEGLSTPVCWEDVISSGVVPDLQAIGLRDPDSFSVGGLHRNVSAWRDILKNHPLAEQVMDWIQNKVDILVFWEQPRGSRICHWERVNRMNISIT